MTRDAKIGLLLGLVFIFIIAFIINGLPSLSRDDGNELTRNMARPQRTRQGIGTEAKQVTQKTITPVRPTTGPAAPEPATAAPQATEGSTDQIRFQAQLPGSPTTVSQLADAGAAAPISNAQDVPSAKTLPTRARIYTVQDGDSLASIAKEFYGEELGNKKASVDRIFRANRKILKSPDQIYVGQKLIIPPLTEAGPDKPEKVLPAESFRPVESIGVRHSAGRLPAEPQAIKLTDKTRYYTVKEGDNLWKIASEQLGDGNRYPELAKINKLEDEDFLVVGARLKLP